MEAWLARFKCSIRMEATYRALQGQWCRQLCLLAISYVELWSIAIIPAVHMTTSDYVSFAAFFLMYGISTWRAQNFLDAFWYPVHLLRPRDYSRLGLGTQKPIRTFYAVSLLLRSACAVAFFSSIAYYYFGTATADNPWACMYHGSDPRWFEYKRSELAEDLSACEAKPNRSSWCSSLTSFERRCGDESAWAERLRSFAQQTLGLGCENRSYRPQAFRPYREAYYCEYYPEPVEVDCMGLSYGYGDARQGSNLIVWFQNEKSSFDQVCPEWPPVPYTSYCEMLFPDLRHCDAVPNWPRLAWESRLSESCKLDSCAANVPPWFRAVSTEEERLFLCRCLSCRPFWLTNECYIDGMDSAFRRRAGAEHRNANEHWLQDPRLGLQFAMMVFMGLGPALWLLLSLILWCMGQLWDLPSDLELEQNIKVEEKLLREEFLATGRIETPKWCGLPLTWIQLCIWAELAFYLADFVTDAEMLLLYLQRHHYGFALVQGCIVLRSLVGQLQQGLLSFCRDVRHSLRSNLRTDRLLSVVQAERTKEASLSFLLQVYALFYMGEETMVYWTALLSFLLSMRGIANGFVIHFDLAIVPRRSERAVAVESSLPRPKAPEQPPPPLEVAEREPERLESAPIGRDASSFSIVMPSSRSGDRIFAV